MHRSSRIHLLLTAIGLMLLILICTSCQQQGGSGGGPVVYPPSWPISELKAPAGSTQAELAVQKTVAWPSMQYTENNSVCVDYRDKGTSYWAVGFHFNGTWEQAAAEVKQAMSGYKLEEVSEEKDPISNKVLNFKASKGGEEWYVSLFNWRQDNWKYWHLEVHTTTWPE